MNDTSTPSAQECKRFNNPAPVDATDKLAFDPACAPFLLRFDGTTFSISNGTTKRNKWRCNGRQKTVTDVWNIIRNRVKYCKKDGKFWQIIHQLHKVNFITSFFNLNRFHISMIYLSIFLKILMESAGNFLFPLSQKKGLSFPSFFLVIKSVATTSPVVGNVSNDPSMSP